jgi:hypothetical protein
MIGLTKTALKKILGKSMVTADELRTMIVEVEAGLNDRPLTYSSSDINDLDALTPSHLMYGFRLTTLPSPHDDVDLKDELYLDRPILTRRQANLAHLLDLFWSRWKSEYLTALRERQRFRGGLIQEPHVGEIVLIHEHCPRLKWKLGRITELHKGIDGHTRSATLSTRAGQTTRGIKLLYPLEIQSIENLQSPIKIGQSTLPKEDDCRPTRMAAIKAREAIRNLAEDSES